MLRTGLPGLNVEGPPVPGVSKIAVLRANAIGDYLFSVPALEALRSAYPGAEIVLLGAPWHHRFLTGRPGPVDRVLVVPPAPGIRAEDPGECWAPSAAAAFADQARAERFDLALQLHGGGAHSNPLVSALGAGLTAGLRADDAPPLDRWVRYIYYQPEVFRYLEVVGLVGAAPVTYHASLPVTPADRSEAQAVIGSPGGPRVALHPGATDTRRRWPADRFAAVGDAAAAAGTEVVVTGTPAERDVVDRVMSGMRAPAIPVVGALSLGGLAGLYEGCTAVVSNDTGPLHLAAAVGAATVGLYWVGNLLNGGPVYRARYRPVTSWTVHCPRCGADCTRDLYPHRAGGPPCDHRDSFLTDIPVAEVVEALLDLLESKPRDPDV
jgi:ADP-heptose:LPS heptosyltransferase